jgi:hypothetical protein
MDHRQHTALTDDALDRDIARLLAVEPSPEFAARVRLRIVSEPAPAGALFARWCKPSALRHAAAAGVALVIVLAVALMRPDRAIAPATVPSLSARATTEALWTLPSGSPTLRSAPAAVITPKRRAISGPDRTAGVVALIDPREAQALEGFFAARRSFSLVVKEGEQPSLSFEPEPIREIRIAPIEFPPLNTDDSDKGVSR